MKTYDPFILPRVSALPTAASLGRMYVLTTDGHVYQENGLVWDDISLTSTPTGVKLTDMTAISAFLSTMELYVNAVGFDRKGTIAQLETYLYKRQRTINVQALTQSPTDAVTFYFGALPKSITATAGQNKIYFRYAGTIKTAEIYCYSGTAGTAEAWSLYIRLNNTTDYLIATLSLATNERVFSNTALTIPIVSGDYIEIKAVNPTWVTNPFTTVFGGYLFIE